MLVESSHALYSCLPDSNRVVIIWFEAPCFLCLTCVLLAPDLDLCCCFGLSGIACTLGKLFSLLSNVHGQLYYNRVNSLTAIRMLLQYFLVTAYLASCLRDCLDGTLLRCLSLEGISQFNLLHLAMLEVLFHEK